MNESTFATSRQAGDLVVAAVALFTLAALVAILVVGEWQKARRLTRANDLRRQRAQRPRLIALAGGLSGPATAQRGMASGAQRARASGVDELVIDDLPLWAERSR